MLEVYNKEISKEKVYGRSRNPDKESNLTSNSSSGPTSFRRQLGSPLAVHLNSISSPVCFFPFFSFFLAGAVGY